MENQEKEIKNYWLQQFTYFDGEFDTTFNILDVDTDKMIIKLAVTKAGKIFVTESDLKFDRNESLYFQFGIDNVKIELNDFETVND